MLSKATFLFFLLSFHALLAQEFEQEDVKTKVRFTIKNFGITVDGQFGKVEIQTNFNSQKLSESYINATIQVSSITTGIKGRDRHILKKNWFDEATYKTIQLKSTRIEKRDNNTYTLFAKLTIKNTTKDIEVPLEIEEFENTISIKSDFAINRKDFKIGGGGFTMSKKVKIQVQYTGVR